MFGTKRLKKKSQSIDIAAQGYGSPLSADSQTSQPSKPAVVLKAATLEEEQQNATNTQRRNPRRTELKRYYTIDTGQKKTPDRRDGRRMSFQKPKGTIEYSVEPKDSLNSISLKFDTTPNELVQLNKLFSRAVVPGQVLYVPDPEYVSSAESSPSLSPISPLSPTSSEAEFEKVTDSDGIQRKEATSSPAHVLPRPARVVSSTSEEEEAFTEKFLKITCKYITDGKGAVSGVLLVTPNNIMFDPHKTDPLVQEHGCEEYGIMCLMEEVMSAALYKDIVDRKMREALPLDLEHFLSSRDVPCFKRMPRSATDELDSKIRDTGNDSTSTAPRSTEESLSEDVFTESELSPIREELVSSDELRQDKSSGASSESVQTINQTGSECCLVTVSGGISTGEDAKNNLDELPASDSGFQSQLVHEEKSEMELKQCFDTSETEMDTSNKADTDGKEQREDSIALDSKDEQPTHTDSLSKKLEGKDAKKTECYEGSVETLNTDMNNKGRQVKDSNSEFETEVEELRKLWKSHAMQQTKQQRENMQQSSYKEVKHKAKTGNGYVEGPVIIKEKKRHRSHKFLCLRVGKPMRKTFVSQASASMQQYAQRDRKHEYWFAVPQERTDHLYAFFVQWSPETYVDDATESSKEPGFMIVKKNEESELNEDTTNEATAKEWEVVSLAEYHRRIDALNTEELRILCRRLKITTKRETNAKQGTDIKAEAEPDSLRPNLSEPSELLQYDQVEKLAKHLPPRTVGYPWTLIYSTSRHGMSIKTLYRSMVEQETPVLMAIKDSDGQIFGALSSDPFKVSDGFYGTGETFLFTFCPEFEV
ncbi:oxidation resistance protein 1 isoform X1 [Protopterus annectens]|uniref:oxidation resistance protein 1 isoform X1 n=1 Tax=Protopterus annectens TaxID=7888 RepID=UPI001CFA3021|nr:oxidation resistance protein 1 isoform X1 [Protopterus annectens]XP_043921637.1 oxidation resistance protein 1 isoform X1 [Protopterus annectens]